MCRPWWSSFVYCLAVGLVFIEHSAYGIKSKQQPTLVIPQDEAGQPISWMATSLGDGTHATFASVQLNIFGHSYILDLEQNRGLISSSFKAIHFHSTRVVVKEQFENCFYHGTIRNVEDSKVVMRTCSGLSGLFYHGKDPETFYFIEPVQESDVLAKQLSDGHLHNVYRAADLDMEVKIFHDGLNSSRNDSQQILYSHGLLDDLKHGRLRRDVVSDEKIIEMVIVNDHSQFVARGSNTTNVEARSISIANIMDMLYKPLNTRIALVGVETWNENDSILVVTDPKQLLTNFGDYRVSELLTRFPSHDNAQLLTNIDFDGDTVGIAPLEGICIDSESVGVNQDNFSEVETATIMAHELGHNLGMEHDDSCSDTKCIMDGCIMRSTDKSSTLATEFSNCSRQEYEQTLQKGFGMCLFNLPSVIFGGPVCGNGFVEAGEGCDCGTPNECVAKNDMCCNSTTCQLFEGANCSSVFSCCTSDCKFESQGTVCRENTTVCDIEEVCTGSSYECPENVQLSDLTPCGAEAVCFRGRCETHDEQCREIWGDGATKADSSCYNTFNILGNVDGNCGKSSSFIACNVSDVQCGVLMCQGGKEEPVINANQDLLYFTGNVTTDDNSTAICKSISVDASDTINYIGYVNDGTQCGTNKLCQAHRCIDFSSLNVPSCPTDQSGNICSGNGVCNNLGECSCSSGFVQPNCTTGKRCM
ncbi:zinc metalloproteinase-disintegrin-like lachestatin-2 isoform X1 [Corticium candelabrum]|uniref:zinc metalloproteinase-disintegrin-like lachestatin-2 isoform X1 n=2 Tax=Corticium candelabrum TaxID=121492 RepID=UPI002E2529C5|nr:zinc metalloproteinase-disintegrin-like lachestatin-2 isoform X1 [Corticium candelabrum]XP_062522367.1 zinc metalloproteinase-disintegrin-like lachestatin-2 isoform X1 [Corticium candelabrum]